MGRRTYTDEDRARVAVALASNGGNVKRTARETGVPVQTVRDWKKKMKRGDLSPATKEAISDVADKFMDDAERVRNKAIEQLEAAIDRKELKPKELLVAIGVLTDKVQAVRNAGKASGGKGGNTININLPTPEKFREQIADYVSTIVDAAKDRDELIVEATDAEWEQAEQKALPPA